MRIESIKLLTGEIELQTGLHIGGSKDAIEIGGIDNPIIKHPDTLLPYIPGSSIKGKMRFWMEWKEGKVDLKRNGEPHGCNSPICPICRIFGTTEKGKKYGPTRLSIMDADLCEEDKEKYLAGQWALEDKVENRINRLSGAATDPRHIERVPPGKKFIFTLTYKVFAIDGEQEDNDGKSIDERNWAYVENALYFLQSEGLGGSVSRGYGRFRFKNMTLDGNDYELTPKENLILPKGGDGIDG